MFRFILLGLLWCGILGCSSTTTTVIEQKPIAHEITPDQLFQEALVLHEQHEYQLALGKYGEVLLKDPTYIRARLYQAGCQFELGKPTEAAANVDQILADSQFETLSAADRADTFRLRGQIFLAQSQASKTVQEQRELLDRAKSNFKQASLIEEK